MILEIITVRVTFIECIDKNGIVSRHIGLGFSDKLPKNFKPVIARKVSDET